MNSKLTRRDFLKLASTLPPVLSLPPSVLQSAAEQNDAPNILVLVFDAWSAHNVSLYGYPRKTTPHLEKLAERAVVYHNHYAGGHFTIAGTASLLTGSLPWRHNIYHGDYELSPVFQEHNLFGLFPEYRRFAYSHNLLAEKVVRKMQDSVGRLKPWQDLYYWSIPLQRFFLNDSDLSSVSWIRSMDLIENGHASSLFFSRVWSFLTSQTNEKLADTYPLGLPNFSNSYSFIPEEAIDWLAQYAASETGPHVTYYHLLPPHDPYNTRMDFFRHFDGDGYAPGSKPVHFLTDGVSDEENKSLQDAYDNYILYVDAEIDRLFRLLQASGSLENTWIVLTSDHGEIFERGLRAHTKPSFFEPLARVPLMIFPPGQRERVDVHAPTSAADILPTLLSVTGRPIPESLEGVVLLPFNSAYDPHRTIFQLDAKTTGLDTPEPSISVMARNENYKLIVHSGSKKYYSGLHGKTVFELYNLEEDPEEITNIADDQPEIFTKLLSEINQKLGDEAGLHIVAANSPPKNT